MGGGTPSHFVRNCSWRRFSWQNISVRNAMNAVNRGRDVFLIFCGEPNTLSRSWYHCLHVLSNASRNVSFCSFAMIAMQKREAGSENLMQINFLNFCRFKWIWGYSPPPLDCPLHYLNGKYHQRARIQSVRINERLVNNRLYFWCKGADVIAFIGTSQTKTSYATGQRICRWQRFWSLQWIRIRSIRTLLFNRLLIDGKLHLRSRLHKKKVSHQMNCVLIAMGLPLTLCIWTPFDCKLCSMMEAGLGPTCGIGCGIISVWGVKFATWTACRRIAAICICCWMLPLDFECCKNWTWGEKNPSGWVPSRLTVNSGAFTLSLFCAANPSKRISTTKTTIQSNKSRSKWSARFTWRPVDLNGWLRPLLNIVLHWQLESKTASFLVALMRHARIACQCRCTTDCKILHIFTIRYHLISHTNLH